MNRPPGVPDMFLSLDVAGQYIPKPDHQLDTIGLGLTLWEGVFEAKPAQWLRWCGSNGEIIPTGAERAERLAAQLRALGAEPEV